MTFSIPKRSAILAIAAFLTVSAATAQTPDTDWYTDAIAVNPDTASFIISTADQLAGLAVLVNSRNSFAGKTITLVNDVDLSAYGAGSAFNEGKGWIPIGKEIPAGDIGFPEFISFSGVFDGAGKTVSGLYINDDELWSAGLFGGVTDGVLKNLGVADVEISARTRVGGLAGRLVGEEGSSIINCYSTGVVSGNNLVGGIVGDIYSSDITNSYSSAAVSGHTSVGGITGNLGNGSNLINSYSIGVVSGSDWVGGLAGHISIYTNIINCAALNSRVIAVNIAANDAWQGRVCGDVGGVDSVTTLSNNVAYIGMTNSTGTAAWWVDKGSDRKDGADISAAEINADGTIGGLFIDTDVWTTEPGKLPGLFGKAVDMPAHLHPDYISIATPDRVIPQGNGSVNDVAVVAPVNTSTTKFTAGPNPINKSSGSVNFYYQGRLIKSGTLTVYNTTGNVVNKIRTYEDPAGRGVARNALTTAESAEPRRVVGSWDLRDRKGRFVADGMYLVRGTIITLDGGREQVSAVVGVR